MALDPTAKLQSKPQAPVGGQIQDGDRGQPTFATDGRDRRIVITDGATIRPTTPADDGRDRRIVITDGATIKPVRPTPPICPPARPPCKPVRPIRHLPCGCFWTGRAIDVVVVERVVVLAPTVSELQEADFAGQDVEVRDVRLVDIGDGETTGPVYRVWVANNANADLTRAFNVALLVSETRTMTKDSPRAFVRIKEMKAGEVVTVNVRLPVTALRMAKAEGKASPFTWLVAVADSHEELTERDTDNNLLLLNRSEIAVAEAH